MDGTPLHESLNTKGVVFNAQKQVACSSLNATLKKAGFNLKDM